MKVKPSEGKPGRTRIVPMDVRVPVSARELMMMFVSLHRGHSKSGVGRQGILEITYTTLRTHEPYRKLPVPLSCCTSARGRPPLSL